MENKTIYAYPSYEKTVLGDIEKTEVVNNGMTLRDYFAGQALIGLMLDKSTTHFDVTKDAYEIANEMMEERCL